MNEGLNVKMITTLDSPELQPYRTLRRSVDHMEHGIFVAEGEKVVRRLLASKLTVLSLLITPERFDQLKRAQEIPQQAAFTVFLADKAILETIVGYNLHQGIMAVAKVPQEPTLDALLDGISKPYLLVALDGLVNSENVGVIVRNCAAFGVDALLVGETSSSPYLRRAVRNSMGAVFQIPVIHAGDLAAALRDLVERHRTKVLATLPHGRSLIHDVDLSGNVCLILGNEGEGVSRRILDVCTGHVAIPMNSAVDSLNVASASAVLLYEAVRQRTIRQEA